MQKAEDFIVETPLKNVYHIQDWAESCTTLIVGSQKALLVDTGTGCGDLKRLIKSLTNKSLIVVNTHSHLDHCGGNFQFDQVFLNEREFRVGHLYMEERNIRPAVLEQFEKMGHHMPEERQKQYLNYHLENADTLKMDEEIDLGGIHVMPVPMYSHSPGMTGFYVKERKLLLGGDSVCIMACLYFQEASSIETHIRMLQEVSKLDFHYILTSHSRELLNRDDFEAMQECAKNYEPSKTFRYADRFYPQFGGRMFLYESVKGKIAIVVAKKEEKYTCKK